MQVIENWWPGTELNRRRQPFQGCALPPELPGHVPRLQKTIRDNLDTAMTMAELPKARLPTLEVCETH
jgi:hypothetical protein